MISPETVGGLLHAATCRDPDRTAVVFPDYRATYRQLSAEVHRWAQRLVGLGVRGGDHVGLSMTNEPDVICLLFAICSIGAVAVPFNPRYRSAELAHVVADSDVSVLVVGTAPADDVDLLERLLEAVPGLRDCDGSLGLDLAAVPRLRFVVSLDPSPARGVLDRAALDARAEALTAEQFEEMLARVLVRAPAMIVYTSGTTAHPKGAVLSHEALVRTSTAIALARYFLRPEDRLWDPLPLFHLSGLLPLLGSVRAGCTFLCMPRVDAAAGLQMLRDERATVAFFAFAKLAMDVIGQPDYSPEDLESLRILHTGGYPELVAKVQAAFPNAVQVNPYGCTEAGGMCATSELTDTAEQRAVYSGRPYPGLEIRVVDPVGRPLGAGQRGEILVRGYSLFEGYYRNPEATAAVLDGDGWFHTGDLGELDTDGRIRFVSRLKDMLKVGGENVACAEIEDLLCRHPLVATAAVVGIPDEQLAEVPVAFVELVPGARLGEDELIAHCSSRIASFKVPRHVRLVTEWPMSATKVRKADLRAQFLATTATGREGSS